MKRPSIGAIFLVNLLAISAGLAGQESSHRHRRYKLVDIGTFGGSDSVYNVFTRIATNGGTVVGAANTADQDPNAPDCFDGETCLVQHAWHWRRGMLTDLGVLTDGFSSYTNAVNDRGLIVGQSQIDGLDPLTGTPALFMATIWNEGRIRSLGTFGGGNSIAIAATNHNFVMGAAENGVADMTGFVGFDGVSQIRAFGWSGGKIFDLGTLGGSGAFPTDMNNMAQVVGTSPTTLISGPFGVAPVAPFLWEKGRMRNLGNLGGHFGGANAINERGQVAGTSNLKGDEVEHPFLWEHGKIKDLGTLGGSYGVGEWLNDLGEVIGYSATTANDAIHAFLWTGKMIDLGTVAGDNSSNAFGINVWGEVVGQSWFWDGHEVTTSHAFLSENGRPMLDLNTLISNQSDMNLVEADYVTDKGLIVARGFLPNGDLHTAILIPDCDRRVGGSDMTSALSEETATSPRAVKAITPDMRKSLTNRVDRILHSDRFQRSVIRFSTAHPVN